MVVVQSPIFTMFLLSDCCTSEFRTCTSNIPPIMDQSIKYHGPVDTEVNIICNAWQDYHPQATKFHNQLHDNSRLAVHWTTVIINPRHPSFSNRIQCNNTWNRHRPSCYCREHSMHKTQIMNGMKDASTHGTFGITWHPRDFQKRPGEGKTT